MGRYTTYNSFEISGYEFSNRYHLQEEIESTKDIIASIEDRIKMWAIADPNTVIPKEDEDGGQITDKVWFVQKSIKDELDSLRDFYKELATLELMDYNWEEQEYPEDEVKKWKEEQERKKKQKEEESQKESQSTSSIPQNVEEDTEQTTVQQNNYSPFDTVHDMKSGEFMQI